MKSLLHNRVVVAITLLLLAVGTFYGWQLSRRTVKHVASVQSVSNPFLPKDVTDHGWPFVRGLKYDGHSAEIQLADAWPESGPPVLWSRSLGQGYSAFVAAGNRVYTQTQTLAGQYVICLDADSGNTLWEHWYDWAYEAAGVYPGPRATPTLYQGRVYFAAPNGMIRCLDAENGQPIWSCNPLEKYKGDGVGFGYACSPTVLEDRVYLPIGGPGASMIALSAHDGSEAWRAGDDAASYSPAYPITFAGRNLLLGYMQNALVCHDRQTGERLWRKELSHGYDEHSAWPIYREPYLWISGPFRSGSRCWQLSSATDPPACEVWSERVLSNDVASSVLVGDHLYGFDLHEAQVKTHRTSRGVFSCVELATGKVAWTNGDVNSRTIPPGAVGHAMVIAADGKLFLLNDEGTLILARANPEKYEELARATVLPSEIVWTPPTLHRGRLYLRNHSGAVCVYVGQSQYLAADQRVSSLSSLANKTGSTVDWTALVLPIEREYVFDVPTTANFIQWYVIQCSFLVIGLMMGIVILITSPSRNFIWAYSLSLGTPCVLGALGTTFVSRWSGEYTFTWPLCLYLLFHVVAVRFPLKRKGLSPHSTRDSWLGAVLLLGSMAGYFWLCRRLSLLFEWSFLCGYLAAWPAVVWDAMTSPSISTPGKRLMFQCATILTGFTLFYWASVGLLWWKYSG